MKKIFAFLLTLALLAGLCPTALAEEPGGSCGENVTWRINSAGVLTISGTGPMNEYDYNRSGRLLMTINQPDGQTGVVFEGFITVAPWADYNGAVTKLVVEEGVTSIGQWAFAGMARLREISLPESLTRIGRCAFYDCVYLQSAVIPDGVTELGDHVFCECIWMRSAVVGTGVRELSYTFDGAMGLSNVVLPEGLEKIGYRSFYGCKLLNEISIPAAVKTIGELAFYETGLSGVVTIGAGVESVEPNSFGASVGITGFVVEEANPWLIAANGGVVKKDGAQLVLVPCGVTEFTVADGVKSIPKGAFDGAYGLKKVVLPEGLEEIGAEAFWDCLALCEVDLPSTLKTIGSSAFRLTMSLAELTLPEGLESIGEEAFIYSGLRRIQVPDSVTSLGKDAFRYCRNLEIAELGSGVMDVNNAFIECSGLRCLVLPAELNRVPSYSTDHCCLLQDVYYRGTQEEWDAINVNTAGNRPLLEAELHPAGTWTEADVTARRRGSGEVSWRLAQDGAVLIISGEGPMPDYAEDGSDVPWAEEAYYARVVIVEEGITHIGQGAFWDGMNLLVISLPSTLRSIGYHAFSLYADGWYTAIPSERKPSKSFLHVYFAGNRALWQHVAAPEGYLGLQYALIHYGVQDVPYDCWDTADHVGELSNVLPGDMDLDGTLTAADARAIFALVSAGTAAPAGTYSDMNGDGRVNNRDAILAFRAVIA